MTLPVAILAGGVATRLRPITETIPKALVEVAGQPFIIYQLEWLKKEGVKRVVLCVGYLGSLIQNVVGDGRHHGIDVFYSFDGNSLLGTGGALRRALPMLGDTFFVLYGDSFLKCDFSSVEAKFRESGQRALMTVFKNIGKWDKSNVIFHDGQIILYDKNKISADMKYIDYGLGVLTDDVLRNYPDGGYFDLAEVYSELSMRGELAGFEVKDRFYEIGSFEGLAEMEKLFSETRTHIK